MRFLKRKGERKIPFTKACYVPTTVPLHLHLIDCPLPGVVGSLTFYNGQGGLDLMLLKRKFLLTCWEGDRKVKESHKCSYRSKKGT